MPAARSLACRAPRALLLAAALAVVGATVPAAATGATQHPVRLGGVALPAQLPGGGSFALYSFGLSQATGGAQPTAWVAPFTEASNGTATKVGHCIEIEQGAANTAAARLRSGDQLSLDNPGRNTIPAGDDDARVAQLEWLLTSSYLHRADADYGNGIAAGAHQSAVWKITNPGSAGNDIGSATPARAQADAMADALLAAAVANAGALDPATWSLTVAGGSGAACAGSARTLTVKGSPNTTARLTITAGTATFANGQGVLDVALGSEGVAEVALIDAGTSADTVSVRASLPDWILAQADNGSNQDFAYLIAGSPVVKTLSLSFVPCTTLGVEVTGAASFTRSYGWAVAKGAGMPVVDEAAGTATIHYGITATRDSGADSAFAVAGEVRVTNPTASAVQAALAASLPGAQCQVAPGVSVPAGSTVAVPYACVLAGPPAGAVTPVLQVVWPRAGMPDGAATGSPTGLQFTSPTTVVRPTVEVLDAFAGAAPVSLGTCAQAACSYAVERTVALPAAGSCMTVANTAIIREGTTEVGTSTVTSSVCRGSGSSVTPGGSPDGGESTGSETTLYLTKSAARKHVTAGRQVRFALRVRNTGTKAARNVQVCDRLPATMVFVAIPKGRMKKGQACFTVKQLKAGGSRKFTVVARALGNVGVGTTCNNATGTAGNASSVTAKVCIATRPRTVTARGGTVGVTG